MGRPKKTPNRLDRVFSALSHPGRRKLLRVLAERGGRSLQELTSELPFTRQAVAQHLDMLEAAGMVLVHREGREKLHYFNSTPLAEAVREVVGPLITKEADALLELRDRLESGTDDEREGAEEASEEASA